ncbi:hypothetical protein LB504_013058 [Fusarium proliferatum]|nr:hypothetical protein LB504_013058 [Fusarium proliferatum]
MYVGQTHYFGNGPIAHRITHNGAVGWPALAQRSTKIDHSTERLLIRHTTDVPRSASVIKICARPRSPVRPTQSVQPVKVQVQSPGSGLKGLPGQPQQQSPISDPLFSADLPHVTDNQGPNIYHLLPHPASSPCSCRPLKFEPF